MGCELQMMCGIIPLLSLRSVDLICGMEALCAIESEGPFHMEPVEIAMPVGLPGRP